MTTTHHLFATETFIAKKNIEYSQLLIDRFILSCLEMDASIVEPFIEEDDVFENKGKYLFLAELKKLFQPYQSKNNIFSVRRDDKTCIGCSKGKKVVQFIVISTNDNREVADFGFVINKDKDILIDIYRCWQYKESQPYEIKPEGLPAITIRDFSCK